MLANAHLRDLVKPLLDSLRGRVSLVGYSLPGAPDPIRQKLYRDYQNQPDRRGSGRGPSRDGSLSARSDRNGVARQNPT